MLVVPTSEYYSCTMRADHSNKTYGAVLPVINDSTGHSLCCARWFKLLSLWIKLSSTIPVLLLIMLYKVVLTCQYVGEVLKCD